MKGKKLSFIANNQCQFSKRKGREISLRIENIYRIFNIRLLSVCKYNRKIMSNMKEEGKQE